MNARATGISLRIIGGAIRPVADTGKGYWPALDGVRALSVLAVIAVHSGIPVGQAGAFGVQVFFVLSGFLITTLLLNELVRTGGVDVGGFYLRRALRLFPALAVLLLFCTLVSLPPGVSYGPQTLSAIPFTILYSYNWVEALAHPPSGGLVTHTWSLAVEEQFYLLWPLILLAAFKLGGGARSVLMVALAGATLSTVWSAVLWSHGNDAARVYYGTDTAATPLMLGCVAAVVFTSVNWTASRRLWARWLGAVGFVVMMIGLNKHFRADLEFMGVQTALEAGTALAILGLVTAPLAPIEGVLRLSPLVLLGRISYGAYLWHAPVIRLLVAGVGLQSWSLFAVGLVLTLLLSGTSYLVIERRFLELKKRIRRSRAAQPLPAVI